jgi:hypothetical protein
LKALDTEVIVVSTGGNRADVLRTRASLKITYPMIPKPSSGTIVKSFQLPTKTGGASFATVVIDKRGTIRFVDDSTDERYRPALGTIKQVLTSIKQ